MGLKIFITSFHFLIFMIGWKKSVQTYNDLWPLHQFYIYSNLMHAYRQHTYCIFFFFYPQKKTDILFAGVFLYMSIFCLKHSSNHLTVHAWGRDDTILIQLSVLCPPSCGKWWGLYGGGIWLNEESAPSYVQLGIWLLLRLNLIISHRLWRDLITGSAPLSHCDPIWCVCVCGGGGGGCIIVK